MKPPVVIVGCGAMKRREATLHRADLLYTGPLFVPALAYARTLAVDDSIRILSALHGLVELDREILPYNQRLSQPGSVKVATVADQLRPLPFAARPIVLLAGYDYSHLFLNARYRAYGLGPQYLRPMEGLGLGQQIQWLKNQLKVSEKGVSNVPE